VKGSKRDGRMSQAHEKRCWSHQQRALGGWRQRKTVTISSVHATLYRSVSCDLRLHCSVRIIQCCCRHHAPLGLHLESNGMDDSILPPLYRTKTVKTHDQECVFQERTTTTTKGVECMLIPSNLLVVQEGIAFSPCLRYIVLFLSSNVRKMRKKKSRLMCAGYRRYLFAHCPCGRGREAKGFKSRREETEKKESKGIGIRR